MKKLRSLKLTKQSVTVVDDRGRPLGRLDQYKFLGLNLRMGKTITTKQLKSMIMTMKQLTLPQLRYLRRATVKKLDAIDREIKSKQLKNRPYYSLTQNKTIRR
jgi:hypothetical protein